MSIDIDWRVDDQFRVLSNLADKPFIFDHERIRSLECVLQSIKIMDSTEQSLYFDRPGSWCKKFGRKIPWDQCRILWWKGNPMDRDGEEYQDFLDRLYGACFAQCEEFRRALIATGDQELLHSIGTADPEFTILTRDEFLTRLYILRDVANKNPA